MKTNKKVALGTVTLGLLAAVATLAVQPPKGWNESQFAFHFPLAADLLMAILHLGGALLLILSLSVYKAKLRLAFSGIVIGILLIGLGTLQLPVLDAFDLWGSKYVTYGFVGLPFLASGLAMYFGAATFGRLVGDKGFVTKKWLILIVAALAAPLSSILPHVTTATPEAAYDITNAIYVWIFVLDLAAAIVFWRVRERIGAHYKVAATWLSLAMLASVTCILIALLDTYIYPTARSPLSQLMNIAVVIAGLAWLKAGYTFTKTKEF